MMNVKYARNYKYEKQKMDNKIILIVRFNIS